MNSALSGYSDSNGGPPGPKPGALANCATPRLRTANIRRFFQIANFFRNTELYFEKLRIFEAFH